MSDFDQIAAVAKAHIFKDPLQLRFVAICSGTCPPKTPLFGGLWRFKNPCKNRVFRLCWFVAVAEVRPRRYSTSCGTVTFPPGPGGDAGWRDQGEWRVGKEATGG